MSAGTARLGRLSGGLIVTALAVLIAAPSAGAAATRAEYVAQADPICKRANEKANRAFTKASLAKLFELAESKGDEKFFRFLAKLDGRANKPLGKMIKRLYTLQPAPGDEVPVLQWLDGLGDHKRLIDRSVRATFRGKLGRAFNFQLDAENALIGGARFVNGFGFDHCPGGEVVTDPITFAARDRFAAGL